MLVSPVYDTVVCRPGSDRVSIVEVGGQYAGRTRGVARLVAMNSGRHLARIGGIRSFDDIEE
jgi:hypothetical protein